MYVVHTQFPIFPENGYLRTAKTVSDMLKKTIWEMGRDTVEQFRAKEKLPVAVVLDNVRSLNNIGSIFRTSAAFPAAEVVL